MVGAAKMGCGASGGAVVEGGHKPGTKRSSLNYEDASAAAKVDDQPQEVDSNEWTRTLGAGTNSPTALTENSHREQSHKEQSHRTVPHNSPTE